VANFVTIQGLNDLNKEYSEIVEVKIPANLKVLNAALELGDLKENSERDAALNEQQRLQARKQEIEEILNDYELIEENVVSKSKVVKIGSHVKIEYVLKSEIYDIIITGATEADALSEPVKISNESPLAIAILGKGVSDVGEFKVKNKIHKVKVLDILV
jgi:transcription elongation factor GreA